MPIVFPDTKLAQGQVNELRGGAPRRYLKGDLWDFLWNVIREIETQIVLHFWSPYTVGRVTAGNSWTAGDVLVEDLSGTSSTYTITKIGDVTYNADTTPRIAIALESASSAATGVKVIFDGPGIPPAVHGLGAGAAGYVRMNTTTSRLERADGTPGEKIIGTINTKGYVRLWRSIPGTVE